MFIRSIFSNPNFSQRASHWIAKSNQYPRNLIYDQTQGWLRIHSRNYRLSFCSNSQRLPAFKKAWEGEQATRHYSPKPIAHKMLTSKAFIPAHDGSWPSIDEIFEHIGYCKIDFSENDVKQSIQLSKTILDNIRNINGLLCFKEPVFEGIGLKSRPDSFTEMIFKPFYCMMGKIPLLTDSVFMHTTTFSCAVKLIESNGEFSNEYFSASLIDPNHPNVTCFPSFIGLILDVPTESIIASYHSDLFAAQNYDSTNHSLIAANYQARVVKNYIQSILINSKIPIEKYSGSNPFVTDLGLNELESLMIQHQCLVKGMTDEEQRSAFYKLFRRKGTGVLEELQHIHAAATRHIQDLVNLHYTSPFHIDGKHLLGKFEGKEELLNRRGRNVQITWNDVLIHSPSSCRELGLSPPKIVGVFKIRDFDSSISSTARKQGLPIYR